MSKNILEFCLSPDLGGLELCAIEYFKYFKTQTYSYLCVAPNKKLDIYLEDENKFTLKRNKLFPILPAFKLAKFIDKNDIDVVHFHWTKDIATVVLGKVLSKRKPKIIQTRHMTMTRFKNDFYHKWLYKNIDTIHAVTYQVKGQLEQFIPSEIRPKLEMVYLGVNEILVNDEKIINLKEQYNIKDEFIVGIVGRIEESKGQYLVIEAIAKLKKLNIKALIVGHAMDESYMAELKLKIKELEIEDKIIFTGFTKDVNEHIKLCDVTVLATPKETFGLVVIESMINKVPVIATANGGPLEIIDNEEDGLLFDRTTENLVEKIELLFINTELKNKLALNGYKKVKEVFDKNTQMQKMYEVIDES
ncbi:glycosyltransferase family 4 protein [Candidatus Sulfurimonas baltica]|uniref:Glycosyltransferase family 4 protein n=1 Tax=Candidatus Sulfurimonas baltica TaxID=2740404 RepID=A0A7S7LVB8_9BACT|nr:glycosyltransferase family 4 protein [Candidatus Sulfurimonas baltica]QOY51424.1 glycosyltransferase family 4 protein [Candidatus Sulfurimonas baltica]